MEAPVAFFACKGSSVVKPGGELMLLKMSLKYCVLLLALILTAVGHAQKPLKLTYLGGVFELHTERGESLPAIGFDLAGESLQDEPCRWDECLLVSCRGQPCAGSWRLMNEGARLVYAPVEAGLTYTVTVVCSRPVIVTGLPVQAEPVGDAVHQQEPLPASVYRIDLPRMVFREYHSIQRVSDKAMAMVRQLGEDWQRAWIVSEKIHGSNYSFWTDGSTVKAARRTGWIVDGDPFFGHASVFERYKNDVVKLFHMARCREGDVLVLYGELYGGDKIQQVIGYQEEMKFAAFDLYHNGVPLDHASFVRHMQEAGIPSVPVVAVCDSFREAVAVSPEFATRLTGDGNVERELRAEGLVIKTAQPSFFDSGRRAIFKSKNPDFDEGGAGRVFYPASPLEKKLEGPLLEFYQRLLCAMTEVRLDSVCSKNGELTSQCRSRYAGLLVRDALTDIATDEQLVEHRSSPRWKQVNAAVFGAASDLVNRRLRTSQKKV